MTKTHGARRPGTAGSDASSVAARWGRASAVRLLVVALLVAAAVALLARALT